MPNGGRLEFDLNNGKVSICVQKGSRFLDILKIAQPIALGAPTNPVRYLATTRRADGTEATSE